MYEPSKIDNKHTSKSNYLFDNSLKMLNDLRVIRNLEDVSNEGKKNSLHQEEIINIPANNFSIIYQKFS